MAKINKKLDKNGISLSLASLLMVSQSLLFPSASLAKVVTRAHGRCLLTTNNTRVFDGYCVIKHKQEQGDETVVVKLENDSKYRFSGPGLQALQVEAWDGIHNVSYKGESDRELFVWDVDGDKHRLSVKADTQHDPNISHDDSTDDALGVAVGAAVGALIGGLLSGGSSSNNSNFSSNNNVSSNPYTTQEYDAVTNFKCSLDKPTHDKSCPGGINRGNSGSASIRVMFPNRKERVYNFEKGNVTSPNGGDLTWGKDGDDWYIGVDNREVIIIPDAAVYGG